MGNYLRHATSGYFVDEATYADRTPGLTERRLTFRCRVRGQQSMGFVLQGRAVLCLVDSNEGTEAISWAMLLVLVSPERERLSR